MTTVAKYPGERKRKKKLTKLRFNRVDVVDQGANFDPSTGDGSHILLMKRHEGDDPKADARWDAAQSLVPLLKSVNEWVVRQPVAKEGEPLDFDDALFARNMGEVSGELMKQFSALMESVDSVMFSDVGDKQGEVTKRVNAFLASVKKTVPGLLKEIDKRADVAGWLAELTALTGAKTMAFDRTTLSTEAEEFVKGIEGSKDAEIETLKAELAKATAKPEGDDGNGDGDPTDVLKGISDPHVRAVIEKMQADAEESRKAAEKAQTELDVEKRVRLIKAETESIQRDLLPALTVDPEKDAPVFMKLRATCPDEWKRVEEILKSAVEIVKSGGTGNLTREVGSNLGGPQGETASEIVTQKAAELMAADDKLDISAAQKKVFAEDADLFKRYREETTVK